MLLIRKSNQRGYADHEWLRSYYTFSFADYYDPSFMGFESLRVINEDFIAAAQGFPTHKHHDMEILTYVVEGLLEHKDSMGTGSQIRPGEIQIMTAGSGVAHSEFNASPTQTLHLLQIWILPNQKNLPPRYDQKTINHEFNKLILLASPTGSDHAVMIYQDVMIYAAFLKSDVKLSHPLTHAAWVQVVKGEIKLNDNVLSAGDGAAIVKEKELNIHSVEDSEFLLFDFLS